MPRESGIAAAGPGGLNSGMNTGMGGIGYNGGQGGNGGTMMGMQ